MTDHEDPQGPTSAPARTFEDVWRDDRRYVLTLATRTLADAGAAEDVVQEAFDRLRGVDLAEIEDVRGWLAVVVRRLSLNRLRSAYARRESTTGTAEATADATGARPAALDPADRVTLDDQVRLALAVVLDRLSPAERTAFVLHDVFGFPYAAVGEIVGRSEAACRQLASRARRSIRADDDAPSAPTPAPALEHQVTERFIAACAGGDLAELMAVLDPDVVGDATLLGHGPIITLAGRFDVASRILGLFGPGSDTVMTPIDLEGKAGLLGFAHGRLAAVIELDEVDGLVHHIHSFIRPPG